MISSSKQCGGALRALGVACALGVPLSIHAQTQTQTQPAPGASAREQQLEQRVDQLEQELAELKSMVQAQKAAAPTTAAPAGATQAAPNSSPTGQGAPVQSVAVAPVKPVFTSAPGVSVALHGFINATAFDQSRNFTYGNGQNAEYPATAGPNGSLSGVDVRNTRFWLDFSGAKFAGDWIGGGRIEMDFFSGFNGTGAYAQQQPTPRLRQAYMDISNPNTGSTVRIGQMWDLMFPLDNVPTSLAHVAFPLGYGTGVVGWRFPGAIWMQDLNHGSSGPQWRLDIGTFGGSWNGPNGAVNNINYMSAGNAGFRPQIEARLHAQGDDWLAYLVGHYSEVDLRGVGNTSPAPIKSNVKSVGYELGGGWKPGAWDLKAQVYSGRGLGEVFGDLSQFGDIKDTGGFAQVGYHFTPHWSANAFYGMSKLDRDDVAQWLSGSGLLRNRQSAFNLIYTAGSYELGLEWLYSKLDVLDDGSSKAIDGHQINVSAMYHF